MFEWQGTVVGFNVVIDVVAVVVDDDVVVECRLVGAVLFLEARGRIHERG